MLFRSAYRSILAVLLGLAFSTSSQAIDLVPWHMEIDTAFKIAKQENRPVLLHFWRPDSAASRDLESTVFNRKSVAETMREAFVPTKINAAQNPSIAAKYRVSRFPTDVILTPNGEEIHRMITLPNAQQYVAQLMAVAFRSGLVPKKDDPSFRERYEARQNQANNVVRASRETPVGNSGGYDFTDQQNDRRTTQSQREVINPYVDPKGGDYVPPRRNEQRSYAEASNGRRPAPPASRQAANDPRQTEYTAQRDVPPNRDIAPRKQAAPRPQPSIALDGYCPVSLLHDEVWKKGDPKFGVIHRGRTYLFAGKQQKDHFYARPDHYSPVLAGIDPVALTDQGRTVEGKRAHGVVYKKRVYLFASEENLERFWKTPDIFAEQVLQAMTGTDRQYR